MSQMPPLLRGYRQGLRDVQRAALMYHQTMPVHAPARAAVSAAADGISVPLRRIREIGIVALGDEVRVHIVEGSTPQLDYGRGYMTGFDQATEIVTGWGTE